MEVRDMKGNPTMWEELSWDDLSDKEKELWGDLGWVQKDWDRNKAPESTDKEWSELTDRERKAASGLGFSEDLWNNTEDQ